MEPLQRQVRGRAVVIGAVYETSVEELWAACTSAERIPRWFLPVSGDLQPGGRYQLEGNAGGVIEECEPPNRFRATWEYGGDVSRIEVRMAAEGEGRARLELTHFVSAEDPKWAEFGPGAVGVGWEMGLLGLRRHLESGGAAVDGQAVGEWFASEEGRAFITASSAAWGDAAVADGQDPGAAKAAADRTTAAYTGAGEG